MFELETKRYLALNELAETGGTVILGNDVDKEIPLCELKQAFNLNEKLYNRSFTELSIQDAIAIYDSCIADLKPDCVLLHIGKDDVKLFDNNPTVFEQHFRKLVQHIKEVDKKCNIGIISLRNPDNSKTIAELNKSLKYIADSEKCEFEDISVKRVWNPIETKDVVSFVYSTGFVRPVKNQRSVYDLTKILFCYEAK